MAASVDARVVRRYAGAIFELARRHDKLEQTSQGLQAVQDVFKNQPQLMVVLLHPRISQSKKEDILHQLFDGKLQADVIHLLLLMVRKDRAAQIPYIAAEFERLLQLHQCESQGEVVSAVPLSDEQTQRLAEQLRAITGFSVKLRKRVDPSLLGGLVVRVGDHMINNSVAHKLELMRERLKQVKVV